MVRSRDAGELLLGEWACLACVARAPTHGFGVAASLAPDGPIGRVWSLSRPLTYRSLDQLRDRGLIEVVGEERGRTGGTRTVFGATTAGRAALDAWLEAPVDHLVDAGTALLVKVVVCDSLGRSREPLLRAQRELLDSVSSDGGRTAEADPATVWQEELSAAVARFLDRLGASTASGHAVASDADE